MKKTVEGYMAAHPYTIGADQTMAVAHRIMREHGIGHLPVLDCGELVGIVTARDLHLVENLKQANPDVVHVDEAMTPHPYIVAPGALVEEVVATMAKHRIGSAIVVEKGRVTGLFTTIDAMHALTELAGAHGPQS